MPRTPAILAGFGAGRLAQGAVGAPLEANAILLKNESGRIIFLQLDVLSVGEHLRRCVLERLAGRLTDDELFVVASHTHYAPAVDPRLPDLGEIAESYLNQVVDTVAELLDCLLSTEPVAIALSYGEAAAALSINRRHWCLAPVLHFPPVKRVMALHPNPEGPRDDMVRTIVARPLSHGATPAGILWNYACHPVTTWPDRAISADYPGSVRQSLRTRFGPDLAVVFLPGFSGNLRPNRIDRFPLSPFYLLHRLVNGPVFGRFTAESSRAWQESLIATVQRALAGQHHPVDVVDFRVVRRSMSMRGLMEGAVDDRKLTFHLVELGSGMAILGLAAEPVVEYETVLDHLFPDRRFIPVGYLDGVSAYLPTSAMLAEGGLEVVSPGYGLENARYRDGLSEAILKQATMIVQPIEGPP